jgi:DNA-binding transcriptional ArsR family regulator
MSAKSSPRSAPAGGQQKRPKLSAVVDASRPPDDSQFDRLVYERVRLGIMSALAVREELTFTELKALFEVSDGNLSAHARKLEEAKYLICTKTFEARRPRTSYRLTTLGRNALNRYLDHVETVIKATRRG